MSASQNSGNEADIFAEQAARRLKKDVQEIDDALAAFFNERATATKIQDDAFDAYELEMKDLGGEEAFEAELSSPVGGADHNILRHANIVRGNSRGGLPTEKSITDEFGIFDSQENDDEDDSHQRSQADSAGLEFKPKTKKLPVPSAEEKRSMRDKMFEMMDLNRQEEARLQAEYEAVRLEGGRAAELAAEQLYLAQRNNAIKLRDLIDDYQPIPFAKSWGNDPDYLNIHSKLKEAMINDDINVKKLICLEAGITKKKKKKSLKSKKKAATS